MATHTVTINRAPVLTLWAAVVAERLGYDQEAALTLGKAVAGLNAQSKGRRLGIFEEPTGPPEGREPIARQPGAQFTVSLLHRRVPVIRTEQGVRATVKGLPIDPAGVRRYLAQKLGHALTDVRAAMETLAKAYPPDQLAAHAYALYERFRPDIPEGKQGWGAAGRLDLDQIRALGEEK
ncbi:MAG TPA: hypothetical protein VLK82_11755 [Candidatus Tectomicrobia bacterium]|nr:hypothetical protein [Candidatus Tectomicrobia bacterium]